MARDGEGAFYPAIDDLDVDTIRFYGTQFHLAAAIQRTPEQWRESSELWRWLCIAQSMSIVNSEYVMQMLQAEAKGDSISPDQLRRVKSWIMGEIQLSIDRVRRGLPSIEGSGVEKH